MPTPTYRPCDSVLLPREASVKTAVKCLRDTGMLIALVVDETGRLLGTVTDGDIRRAILADIDLGDSIANWCNPNPKKVNPEAPATTAEELCLKHRITRIPVVDREGKPVGLYFLEDFIETPARPRERSNPVVVMAGGRGTRLDPFTRILPKPLIPIGNKAAIEAILDSFHGSGFNRFILSVNYRKEFIKTYFSELLPLAYSLEFVDEDQPLGTIGALGLMKDRLKESFIVSNCDMLFDLDWGDVLDTHQKRGLDITILGGLRTMQVPYGVIELEGERFKGITEKPEYSMLVNLGIYLCEPRVLDLVEANERLDATTLIERARDRNLRVGVHPILNNWHDIGQWEEYRSLINQLGVV